MMSRQVFHSLRRGLSSSGRRNIGMCAPALQKATDSIQQLFLDKIREYAEKSKSSGGKLVEPTPEIDKELKAELSRVALQYGGKQGEDMTKFPELSFPEPKLDPVVQSQS